MSVPHGQSDHPLPNGGRTVFGGKWMLGCLGATALILAVGALVPWLYFVVRHQRALAAVQAEVDRIHAAGELITTEDLVAFHRVPEGAFDATPLWLDALKSAEKTKDGNESQLPYVGDGRVEDLAADSQTTVLPLAQQFLADHTETIEKTRKAAAAGGQCLYPINFSEGQFTSLPHIVSAYTLMRVLSLRLHVAVESSDVATAIESLELELGLAGTLGRELDMVSQLVQMALNERAINDTHTLSSDLPLSEQQMAELQQRISAIDFQRMVKDGIVGERAGGYHTFHHLDVKKMLAGENGRLTRPVDLQIYLGFMREMVAAADQPLDVARVTAKQIEDQLKQQIAARGPHSAKESALTQLLAPTLSDMFDTCARNQAKRDAAVAGIAFRRYQLKHGSPPDSLQTLVPEFLAEAPRDPFAAGEPLKLVIHDGKYFIYSIGVNNKDDKALLRDPASYDDVGFVAKLAVPTPARHDD